MGMLPHRILAAALAVAILVRATAAQAESQETPSTAAPDFDATKAHRREYMLRSCLQAFSRISAPAAAATGMGKTVKECFASNTRLDFLLANIALADFANQWHPFLLQNKLLHASIHLTSENMYWLSPTRSAARVLLHFVGADGCVLPVHAIVRFQMASPYGMVTRMSVSAPSMPSSLSESFCAYKGPDNSHLDELSGKMRIIDSYFASGNTGRDFASTFTGTEVVYTSPLEGVFSGKEAYVNQVERLHNLGFRLISFASREAYVYDDKTITSTATLVYRSDLCSRYLSFDVAIAATFNEDSEIVALDLYHVDMQAAVRDFKLCTTPNPRHNRAPPSNDGNLAKAPSPHTEL